ncbi:ATP-dependent DNA ligase [Marmoricola sp. RAF53]|uniref:ATP-dependent DNA ligase n=1 Tax=Marmoricola sp. RAF53 TaxID=3233059 RepID=UPI003F999943
MLLADLVTTSARVAGTRSRTAKRGFLAELLRAVPADEIEIAAAYLSGTLRQRRTGVGWRGLADLPAPAAGPSLHLTAIDARLEALSALAGEGSATARRAAVAELFGALTADEQDYLRAVMTGAVRQGALDSVLLDAIAEAAEVPLAAVRRAAMFSAPTGPVARAALTGGVAALESFGLEVGRPIRPMLASSAADVAAGFGPLAAAGPVVVDTKLDGIRIQVHRSGDDVRVFTRSLDDVTDRLPDVVAAVRSLPADGLILDGEALTLTEDGRPRPFQETASRTASTDGTGNGPVVPFFFDLLAAEGESFLEAPGADRWDALDRIVPPAMRTARLVTSDPAEATAFFEARVADGQEGVILKRGDAPYDAGRRGAAWVKVKPRHTLDLVVLAVEHGSGRRRGWLSNIHLGARDPGANDGEGGFVMLGKTFKGMTDEMLVWQTERFRELQTEDDGWVVTVRPEQVVEVAFDGLQRSTRYPGGVALRFARVLRYRDDKSAAEADTIETVRALSR